VLLEAQRARLNPSPYWKIQAPRIVPPPTVAIAIAAYAIGRDRIMLIMISLMPASRSWSM
jgi:hypothetical protein